MRFSQASIPPISTSSHRFAYTRLYNCHQWHLWPPYFGLPAAGRHYYEDHASRRCAYDVSPHLNHLQFLYLHQHASPRATPRPLNCPAEYASVCQFSLAIGHCISVDSPSQKQNQNLPPAPLHPQQVSLSPRRMDSHAPQRPGSHRLSHAPLCQK